MVQVFDVGDLSAMGNLGQIEGKKLCIFFQSVEEQTAQRRTNPKKRIGLIWASVSLALVLVIEPSVAGSSGPVGIGILEPLGGFSLASSGLVLVLSCELTIAPWKRRGGEEWGL